MADHATIERRSLELHRLVAARLPAEPQLLQRAQERLERWLGLGTLHPAIAAEWRTLLRLGPDAVAVAIVEDSERMRDLRQSSPLACEVPNAERLAVIRAFPTVGGLLDVARARA